MHGYYYLWILKVIQQIEGEVMHLMSQNNQELEGKMARNIYKKSLQIQRGKNYKKCLINVIKYDIVMQ